MGTLNSQKNHIVWVDIPVQNLDRATEFYRDVLGVKVHRENEAGTEFAVLEDREGNGACLISSESGTGGKGPLIYLNADGHLRDAVERVRRNGGEVVQDVHPIRRHGFRAIVNDPEGNRLALHSWADD